MSESERVKSSMIAARRAHGRSHASIVSVLTWIVASMLAAGVASASDGVLEINQTCALVGCFPGDNGGFPVLITSSAGAKSFRLTSDLTVPASSRGISSSVDGISIDLNGFSIQGPVTCSGSPATCSAPILSTADGITLGGDAVSVRNGRIAGFEGTGITVGSGSIVEHVRVEQNAGDGIDAGIGSVVRKATASSNGRSGILARVLQLAAGAGSSSSSTIEGCTVVNNQLHGIVGGSSVVRGNAVSGSGSIGISISEGAIASDNLVRLNGSDGVFVTNVSGNPFQGNGSVLVRNASSENSGMGINGDGKSLVVRENTAYNNDGIGINVTGFGSVVEANTSRENGGDGFSVSNASLVKGNAARSNTGAGFRLGSGVGYLHNVSSGNAGGDAVGGVEMDTNLCGGTIGCP